MSAIPELRRRRAGDRFGRASPRRARRSAGGATRTARGRAPRRRARGARAATAGPFPRVRARIARRATRRRKQKDGSRRRARRRVGAPSPRVAAFHAAEWGAPRVRGGGRTGALLRRRAGRRERREDVPGEPRARRRSLRRACEIAAAAAAAAAAPRSPTGALLAALTTLGDDRRTAEQWLWLLTAVLEALARETEVVREVAAYVSRATPSSESFRRRSTEGGLLDAETLAGCAGTWRARAFVDEALLRVLAGAEPPA